jgi:acetyl-CoA carboxylase alpha subunit
MNIKSFLKESIDFFEKEPLDKMLEQRYTRLMKYGNYTSD